MTETLISINFQVKSVHLKASFLKITKHHTYIFITNEYLMKNVDILIGLIGEAFSKEHMLAICVQYTG